MNGQTDVCIEIKQDISSFISDWLLIVCTLICDVDQSKVILNPLTILIFLIETPLDQNYCSLEDIFIDMINTETSSMSYYL